jgi:hypothetical protein
MKKSGRLRTPPKFIAIRVFIALLRVSLVVIRSAGLHARIARNTLSNRMHQGNLIVSRPPPA